MNWIKENWKIVGIAIIILVIVVIFVDGSGGVRKDSWQGVYYPDGCLSCENSYIWSPFFNTVNECINWVHAKAETRGNNTSDAAECFYDCENSDVFDGLLVCEETIDVLGNPSL